MILEDLQRRQTVEGKDVYPLLLPAYDGMRMTRRLSGVYTLDESEAFCDFPDSIGLTAIGASAARCSPSPGARLWA